MRISNSYKALLSVLPLHAEEGGLKECRNESAIVSAVAAADNPPLAAQAIVSVIRRLLESMNLLDANLLTKGQWAFISFPASLVARSVLETLANPESSFFDSTYWTQGLHRPSEVVEKQRRLLQRLEHQRVGNLGGKANPIRTVHVAWGVVRFGRSFLLHRREDKDRTDVGRYVLPGGRLEPGDLDVANRTSDTLQDLFRIDSPLAQAALKVTLGRELLEELQLVPDDYDATHLKTLAPYRKIEGTRNNHSYSQYNIAVYSIRLNQTGVQKSLNQISTRPMDWEWFTASELVSGGRPDGKRAFLDALLREPRKDVLHLLERSITDSCPQPAYMPPGKAIAFPDSFEIPTRVGISGRQQTLPASLNRAEWELLMLLAWHARSLEIEVAPAANCPFTLMIGSWIQFKSKETQATALELAQKFREQTLIECDLNGICRLSVDAEKVFLQPQCFDYFWDLEGEEKPLYVRLKEIKTQWATLRAQSVRVRLSPMLFSAFRAIHAGQAPAEDRESISREFKRVMGPTEAIGLQQFVSWKGTQHEILIEESIQGH